MKRTITRDAGYSYLPGGAERAVVEPDFLAERLVAGKEFYLSVTPDWSGYLVVSRYVAV